MIIHKSLKDNDPFITKHGFSLELRTNSTKFERSQPDLS